jgi:phosphoribosylglycinamide formyltransferase 1
MVMALPVAILISGTGSNLRAILEAADAGRCDVSVRVVISDRDSAAGLELARSRKIPARVVKLKDFADRARWDQALAATVAEYEPALVVLAGFMRLVGDAMITRFAGRIINVHPALLPLFPGKDGPAQAVRAGVRVSGCTVHVVDSGIDTGPIIAQAVVPVLPDDDADRLHQRIQRAEHRLLPAVIDGVARERVELGAEPRVDARWFDAAAILVSPALVAKGT